MQKHILVATCASTKSHASWKIKNNHFRILRMGFGGRCASRISSKFSPAPVNAEMREH